jgi:hypothetical protein
VAVADAGGRQRALERRLTELRVSARAREAPDVDERLDTYVVQRVGCRDRS